jgi:hypothetical protein
VQAPRMTSDDERSVSSEGSEGSMDVAEVIRSEPMYYVLSQFLEEGTDNNPRNICDLLAELVHELKGIKLAMRDAKKDKKEAK